MAVDSHRQIARCEVRICRFFIGRKGQTLSTSSFWSVVNLETKYMKNSGSNEILLMNSVGYFMLICLSLVGSMVSKNVH